MSRREGVRILALGFSAGAVGGFVGIAVTSWLADGHKVLGASWWEVMTAFGTVGAVLGAVYQSTAVARERNRLNSQKIGGALALINEAVYSALWVAGHIKRFRENSQSGGHEVLALADDEIQSFIASVDTVLNMPFYEEPFSEIIHEIMPVLSLLKTLRALANETVQSLSVSERTSIFFPSHSETAFEEFEVAISKSPRLQGYGLPKSLYQYT